MLNHKNVIDEDYSTFSGTVKSIEGTVSSVICQLVAILALHCLGELCLL